MVLDRLACRIQSGVEASPLGPSWPARPYRWRNLGAPTATRTLASHAYDPIVRPWPQKTREIAQYVVDSARWNGFAFRDDDIVIATWAKTGTTLTQQVVGQLIFKGDPEIFGMAHSPWIDSRLIPNAQQQAEAQTHRRFLKTHLPVDALVFSPKARYIYVGRDARDVCWSWYHHQVNFTPETYDTLNAFPGRAGPPIARPGGDIRAYYHAWLDNDGWPAPSFWANVQGWWDIRRLPNVLLVHFARLKADLPAEIRRIGAFLDVPIDEALLPAMVEHCGLEHMRRQAAAFERLKHRFKGGGATFINKGTNERWRDVLSPAEIAKCDAIAAERLTPDCARWLATGALPD